MGSRSEEVKFTSLWASRLLYNAGSNFYREIGIHRQKKMMNELI